MGKNLWPSRVEPPTTGPPGDPPACCCSHAPETSSCTPVPRMWPSPPPPTENRDLKKRHPGNPASGASWNSSHPPGAGKCVFRHRDFGKTPILYKWRLPSVVPVWSQIIKIPFQKWWTYWIHHQSFQPIWLVVNLGKHYQQAPRCLLYLPHDFGGHLHWYST